MPTFEKRPPRIWTTFAASGTMDVVMVERRPGLAKVRGIPVKGIRRLELVALAPPRTLAWIQGADVISEGAERLERGDLFYYGSSSLILTVEEHEAEGLAAMVQALAADPHVRLHALRVARAEVASRATGAVGTMRADISLHPTPGGLEIVVDVCVRIASAARVLV